MRASLAGSLAVAAFVAATLVGCTPPDDPQPSPSSSPTESTGAPTSEAELLDAARVTYEGYLQSIATMRAAGKNDYTMLLEFATDRAATDATSSVQELIDEGHSITGAPALVNMLLVGSPGSASEPLVVAICTDATNVRVLDPAGIDVTAVDRQVIYSKTAKLVWDERLDRFLLNEESPGVGGGEDPCA